jgi:hypothetical protein
MRVRFDDAGRYPVEHAFYTALPGAARLVQTFDPGLDGRGPLIRVFALDG